MNFSKDSLTGAGAGKSNDMITVALLTHGRVVLHFTDCPPDQAYKYIFR